MSAAAAWFTPWRRLIAIRSSQFLAYLWLCALGGHSCSLPITPINARCACMRRHSRGRLGILCSPPSCPKNEPGFGPTCSPEHCGTMPTNRLSRLGSQMPRCGPWRTAVCSNVASPNASSAIARRCNLSWMIFPAWEGYLSHEVRWIDRPIFSSAGRRRSLQAPLCAKVLRRPRGTGLCHEEQEGQQVFTESAWRRARAP